MVKVDFTSYKSFSTCPVWWRNFVIAAQKDLLGRPRHEKHRALNIEIEKFHGSIIDAEEGNGNDIDYLAFDTEEDFDTFKLHWTLYGC